MGVAGKHVDGLYPLAAHLEVQHLVRADATLLDKRPAAHHDEQLPLAVVPVLALGDSRLRDVDAELTALRGLQQLRERAAPVCVHLQGKYRLLLRQVAQISGVELLGEGALRYLRHDKSRGLLHERLQQVHYLTQSHAVRHRAVAVHAIFIRYDLNAVIPASVLLADKGAYHLVHKVVDVQQLQFHRGVVDLYREVVGEVVAEGRHCRVVVRTAPLAEEVREPVDKNPRPGCGGVHEEQVLASLLAPPVLAVSEAAREGGLDRGGQHHGAGVPVLSECVEEGGREAAVALHELPVVLRAVHAREVEHEVAVAAPYIQLLRSRVEVVFIYFADFEITVAPGLALPDVVELRAEVPADESPRAGDKYFHYLCSDFVICVCRGFQNNIRRRIFVRRLLFPHGGRCGWYPDLLRPDVAGLRPGYQTEVLLDEAQAHQLLLHALDVQPARVVAVVVLDARDVLAALLEELVVVQVARVAGNAVVVAHMR